MSRRTPREDDVDRAPETTVRIDKWLWAARFYRTRSLAAQAVEASQVRINGERVKPSHAVRPGSRVTVRKQELTFDVEVLEVSDRRGSASIAATLYRETAQSINARATAIAERRAAHARMLAHAQGRPTKRDRRKLEDFLNEP